ncbi:hypothetical protein [Pontibacillus yanchengensis]|uniref:Uncharacterized protein n=1 Tax=Pontibacillus yanchengensis Y32 TaxID=1385514 RepID=A0A0A2TCQ4_9BACI|nr:hypothetical protein [Pontibacillus yanchengensis]KGP72208.1 hypothetical protein N782_08275 [Pontibacillus yanchengensis Y32]
MTQISSYQVHFNQRISMEEIMNIYRFVSKGTYDVYLYQDDLIADVSNLPKLLSFFLYYQKKSPILMIIDGENVEYAYEKIIKVCEKPLEKCEVRSNHEAPAHVAIQV